MADEDTYRVLIRRALNDPGKHAERRPLHEGLDGSLAYESLAEWQARAVIAALANAGYRIAKGRPSLPDPEEVRRD